MKSLVRNSAALALVACFNGQVLAADMVQSLGKGEGQVNIIAWPGYIERGENDKNYDWVTGSRRKPAARSM